MAGSQIDTTLPSLRLLFSVALCALPACVARQSAYQYNVTLLRRDSSPLVSHADNTSDFSFNFNPGYFAGPNGTDGLVVRVVECNADHHPCVNQSHPEWTNAGALVVVPANLSATPPTAARVTSATVTWGGAPPPPHSDGPLWGAADPRLAFHNGTYFMTWDNCTQNCYPVRITQLSTSRDPFDPLGWTWHGPLVGGYNGGASLLFQDAPPHLAFVSDSNTAGALLIATSETGFEWNLTNQTLLAGRPGYWDAPGVGAGPQPQRLSTGDWLYVYNVDTGFPYHPNPIGRCAVGWAVLDGADPTRVVARSDEPLMTAVLPWEECPRQNYTCQQTMVVWAEGLRPSQSSVATSAAGASDVFDLLYGGGDTDVGFAVIEVAWA